MSEAWLGLILGVILASSGMMKLITNEPGYAWGVFPVPAWTGWLLIPIGVIIFILSFRALRRKPRRPPSFTEEDARKAEAEMDAMYFKEHGELPEKQNKND